MSDKDPAITALMLKAVEEGHIEEDTMKEMLQSIYDHSDNIPTTICVIGEVLDKVNIRLVELYDSMGENIDGSILTAYGEVVTTLAGSVENLTKSNSTT